MQDGTYEARPDAGWLEGLGQGGYDAAVELCYEGAVLKPILTLGGAQCYPACTRFRVLPSCPPGTFRAGGRCADCPTHSRCAGGARDEAVAVPCPPGQHASKNRAVRPPTAPALPSPP